MDAFMQLTFSFNQLFFIQLKQYFLKRTLVWVREPTPAYAAVVPSYAMYDMVNYIGFAYRADKKYHY